MSTARMSLLRTSVRFLRRLQTRTAHKESSYEIADIVREVLTRINPSPSHQRNPSLPTSTHLPLSQALFYPLDLPKVFKVHKLPLVPANGKISEELAQNLGSICIEHTLTKYILQTRPQKNDKEIQNYTKELYKSVCENLDTNSLSFSRTIGYFCYEDEAECEKYLISLLGEDARTKALSRLFGTYLNLIVSSDIEIDYNLIWNTSIPNVDFELPKLEKFNAFNLSYLFSTSVLKKYLGRLVHGDKQLILNKHEQLYSFGKLAFTYYTTLSVLRRHSDTSELYRAIDTIVDSAMTFIKLSGIRNVVASPESLTILRRENLPSTDFFFRFLGLLEIENSQLVRSWIQNLVDSSLHGLQDQLFKKKYSSVNNVQLSLKKPDVSNSNSLQIHHLGLLGKSFLDYIASKLALSSDVVHIYENTDRIHSQVENIFRKSFGVSSDHLPLIGKFTSTISPENFSSILKEVSSDTSVFNLKHLLSTRATPSITMNESQFDHKDTFTFPKLNDRSRISRLLMVNDSIIQRKKHNHGTNSWKYDGILKIHLVAWKLHGQALFEYHLRKSLYEHLHRDHLENLEDLFKILTSTSFAKVALDSADVFNGIIQDNSYIEYLIQSSDKGLAMSQFGQYVSALDLQDSEIIPRWTDNISRLFAQLFDTLRVEDINPFIRELDRQVHSHRFSLTEARNKKRFEELELHFGKGQPVQEPVHEPAQLRQLHAYQKYVVDLFLLNERLPSFIEKRHDMLRFLEDSVSAPNFNYAMLQSIGNMSAFRQVLEQAWGGSYRPFDAKIPHLNYEVSELKSGPGLYCWNQELCLPRAESTLLHKLLLVNYFLSREFFKSMGIRSKNVHTYPDICTKFGTMGGDYYNYLVVKHVEHYFQGESADSIIALLQDRQFMAIICSFSELLYHPIELDHYTSSMEQHVTNNYYNLRYSSQSFRQYIGLISHQNPSLVDSWVEKIVTSLYNHEGDVDTKIRHLTHFIEQRFEMFASD